MIKLLILLLAMVGTSVLVALYFPSAWSDGFWIGTHLLSYGMLILGAIAILAFRLKGD